MVPPLKIRAEPTAVADSKTRIFHLAGSVDAAATAKLQAAATAALDEGAKYLVLDFAEVNYISSAGLRLLLSFRKATLDAGGAVKVAGLPREIRENVFDALGFSRLLDVYGTVKDAVESIEEKAEGEA